MRDPSALLVATATLRLDGPEVKVFGETHQKGGDVLPEGVAPAGLPEIRRRCQRSPPGCGCRRWEREAKAGAVRFQGLIGEGAAVCAGV
jgi:hypothetical protein